MELSEIKQAIEKLSKEERQQLLSDLKLEHYQQKGYLSLLLEKAERDMVKRCPRCGGEHIWSRGSHKGVKRLQCKDCGRYFSSNTGTAIHQIHKKDKWQAYLQCMEERLPLRKAAKEVGISLQTAFNWRHKILSSLKELESDHFKGVVEADEFYLRFSEKGRKDLDRPPRKRGGQGKATEGENKVGVLVVTDRKGNKMARVAGKSTMTKKALEKSLAGKIYKNSILCTDSYKVYRGLAKKEKLRHIEVVNKGRPTQQNKAYHIQTVNYLHGAIRSHLNKFKGVSSRYLQNYLYWFIAMSNQIKESEKVKLWFWLSLSVANALADLEKLKTGAPYIST